MFGVSRSIFSNDVDIRPLAMLVAVFYLLFILLRILILLPLLRSPRPIAPSVSARVR
jgi:hypothetical protein